MPQNQKNSTKEAKNDTLAFIIGGIFILGLVFATYNYFTNSGSEEMNGEGEKRGLTLERLRETLSTNTQKDDEEENQGGVNAQTEETDGSGDVAGTTTETWTANDYSEGEISAGQYTVQYGDTLWEIAEAVYGNGSMWTKIRDANSGSIDYLPNGQQALIYAGQVLTIPAN